MDRPHQDRRRAGPGVAGRHPEGYAAGEEVCVLINGLGATSIEELYILSGSVRKLLDGKGIKTYRTFVGEYATSMEMAGASISICKMSGDEMKQWIDMPVHTPFYTQV